MLRSNLNTINARIFNKTAIRIDDQALREVEACYRFLEKFEQGKVIYGINTGFGPMAQYRIGDAELNSSSTTSSVRTAAARARHCPTSACGRRCWRGCKRSSTPSRAYTPTWCGYWPISSTTKFTRSCRATAAWAQAATGAAGAYRTGADRRSGGLVPGRNRPGSRGDGGMRHNALRLRIRDGRWRSRTARP